MKKTLAAFAVFFIVFSVTVFGQTVDKAQYKAIDPFDYKLDEEKAAANAVRKFKSVVLYVSQDGTRFIFNSLDQGTTLDLNVSRTFNPPSAAQKVIIYYTATKGIRDALVLDEIDFNNPTEEGIGLVKSKVPASSGIKKADYKEIDPFDYKSDSEHAQNGEIRKYKSQVQYSAQSGLIYSFVSMDNGTLLTMKVGRRFPQFTPNQKVTVYYTATKGFVDSLALDDVD